MLEEIRSYLKIRDMDIADIGRVYALDRDSFNKAWTAEQMRHEMDLYGVKARVLEWKGTLVAYYFSSFVAGEASLNRIAVDSRFRGVGIGRLIMDDFLRACHMMEAEEAFLEVNVKNSFAIKLYEGSGFERVGKRSSYYEDGSDALVMKLDFKEKDRFLYSTEGDKCVYTSY